MEHNKCKYLSILYSSSVLFLISRRYTRKITNSWDFVGLHQMKGNDVYKECVANQMYNSKVFFFHVKPTKVKI